VAVAFNIFFVVTSTDQVKEQQMNQNPGSNCSVHLTIL